MCIVNTQQLYSVLDMRPACPLRSCSLRIIPFLVIASLLVPDAASAKCIGNDCTNGEHHFLSWFAQARQRVQAHSSNKLQPAKRLPPLLHRYTLRQDVDDARVASNFNSTDNANKCSISTDSLALRKVLQINGTADDVVHMTLCLRGAINISEVEFVDGSSNEEVLSVRDGNASDVEMNKATSGALGCHNITITFTFDKFVGKANYTLSLRNPGDEVELCSESIEFWVIGLTIYEEANLQGIAEPAPGVKMLSRTLVPSNEDPTRMKRILSGTANEFKSDYRTALKNRFQDFKVKVQYADGSDSSSQPLDFVANSVASLELVSDVDSSSPVLFNETLCPIIEPSADGGLNETMSARSTQPCGAAFGTADMNSGSNGLAFGVRFENYRAGVVHLAFEWASLTSADSFLSDELYTNVFQIHVSGNPPPVVLQVQNTGPFLRAGGENVTVILDNTDGSIRRTLRVAGVSFPEILESYTQLENGLDSVVFFTPPGRGVDLIWHVDVLYPSLETKTAVRVSESPMPDMSYSTTELHLSMLKPRYGQENVTVILEGYFDGFDPGQEQHAIYMGTKRLDSSVTSPARSGDGKKISFTVPARNEVGAAFEYLVRVVVDDETTQSLSFMYIDADVTLNIDVFGASYNVNEGLHDIGRCAVTSYVARLPAGVPEQKAFFWRVFNVSEPQVNLLDDFPAVSAKSMALWLPPKVFSGREGVFEISTVVGVGDRELKARTLVRKVADPRIGIKLSVPETRSLAVPDVPLRLSAFVERPRVECYNASVKIMYDWTFDGQLQSFSYLNFSGSDLNGTSSPARLGREFIVPQKRLRYGDLNISLHAYMMDDPSVYGYAETMVTVQPAQLVPIIGYGASHVVHSTASDLTVTCENSYNPDGALLGNDNISFSEWTCYVSDDAEKQSRVEACESDLLPDKNAMSFQVPSDKLVKLRNKRSSGSNGLSRLFLHYRLRVSADFQLSPETSQIVEVLYDDFQVATLTDIAILDSRGMPFDCRRIRYFEDLLLAPEGDRVSWEFQLLRPIAQASVFQDLEKLIIHPGYFDPTSELRSQDLPLGIRANAFLPGEEYEISLLLTSAETGIERGESRFILTMQDQPTLVFPNLPVIFGDSGTTFIAMAMANLDKHYGFLYYFYLISDSGEHFCLDGCSGAPHAQFQIAEAGHYAVLCKLVDIHGNSVLDQKLNKLNITVTAETLEVGSLSEGVALSEFQSTLKDMHFSGDHGTFELLVASLANRMQSNNIHAFSDRDMQVLDLAVNSMYQIVLNSAPTTMTSKNYVQIASRFVRLDSEFFESEQTMYTVFAMVDKAISQVPATEAFDLQEDLLTFYNLSTRHVMSALSGYSVRVRLQQFGSGSGLDARSLLIDLYRLLQEHLTIVVSKDAECGMIKRFTTKVPDGVNPGSIERFIFESRKAKIAVGDVNSSSITDDEFDTLERYETLSEQPAHISITIAVLCNSEQAKGLRGEDSEFRWCDEVFTTDPGMANKTSFDLNQKRIFTIMESLDYAWLSGLSGEEAKTDTRFLVSTNVTVVGPDNLLIPLQQHAIPGCFTLNTTMTRLGVTEGSGCLGARGYSVESIGAPFEQRVFMKDVRRNFSTITANISHDGSSTVVVHSSYPGVFGVLGLDCPISARKPDLELPVGEGAAFGYVLFGALIAVIVGVVLVWVGTSSIYVQSSGAV